MISHTHKCVFVHIPKTAGQSIEHFFLDLHGLTWKQKEQLLISRNEDRKIGPARLCHLTAEEYYDLGHISKEDFDNYFTFGFVRNPWERLVSEYLHKKIDKQMTLKEFVFKGLPKEDKFCDKHRHIIPQSDYLFDSKGNQLVDFIARFENLADDFDYVCKQLTIEDSTLPHKNSLYSPRRFLLRKLRYIFSLNSPVKQHYTQYYDQELHARVQEMYAQDIARFNYSFGKQQLKLDTQQQLLID